MLRDSRIVHIIDLLGELRELLLVIDQAGDTAPAILLKLAKEKAEEITRSTRELRQPEFWDGILRYDPFTSVKTTTHEDAIPSMENPLEKFGEPVSSRITNENIIPTEKQSEESDEELDTDNNIADTEDSKVTTYLYGTDIFGRGWKELKDDVSNWQMQQDLLN